MTLIGSSVIKAIVVAIENAIALCPLGMPPFNGVPSPNIAFTINVVIDTNISTKNIKYGSEFFILSIVENVISLNLSQNIIYPTIRAFIAVTKTAPAATFFAIFARGW